MNNRVIRQKLNILIDVMKGWCKFTFWVLLMLQITHLPIGCAVLGAVGILKVVMCLGLTVPFIATCDGVEIEVLE